MKTRKLHMRSRDCTVHMDCPMAANPEEFISRDPIMSMRSL
jgi:hypothetical protein